MEGSSLEIRQMVENHEVDFGWTSSPFGNLDNHIVFTDRMLAVGNIPFEED